MADDQNNDAGNGTVASTLLLHFPGKSIPRPSEPVKSRSQELLERQLVAATKLVEGQRKVRQAMINLDNRRPAGEPPPTVPERRGPRSVTSFFEAFEAVTEMLEEAAALMQEDTADLETMF